MNFGALHDRFVLSEVIDAFQASRSEVTDAFQASRNDFSQRGSRERVRRWPRPEPK
jgi:hypothetical protein